MFVPISLVFFNVLSSILILSSSWLDMYSGVLKINPEEDSWITHYLVNSNFTNPSPILLYIIAYYWMASTTLSVGFGDIKAQQAYEMYFIIFSIIAGYLMFTYVLVVITSSIASVNINLTLYQEHMKHLVKYMSREKIDKELQRKAIDHFEYTWQRTHGLRANNLLKNCHRALEHDTVLSLYEATLTEVPVFNDLNRPFFRSLGMFLEEAYYLRDVPIIKINDIVSHLYIVHKGEAVVKGPDGTIFATLTKGW